MDNVNFRTRVTMITEFIQERMKYNSKVLIKIDNSEVYSEVRQLMYIRFDASGDLNDYNETIEYICIQKKEHKDKHHYTIWDVYGITEQYNDMLVLDPMTGMVALTTNKEVSIDLSKVSTEDLLKEIERRIG